MCFVDSISYRAPIRVTSVNPDIGHHKGALVLRLPWMPVGRQVDRVAQPTVKKRRKSTHEERDVMEELIGSTGMGPLWPAMV